MNGPAPVIDRSELLASAEALGALPATVCRLATVVSTPDHDVRDIVEVVSFDQALTATLLRRANSAALGARYQITTVRDAAMWLGSGALLSMALATNVSRRLSTPIPAYGLTEGQLWKQSVAAMLAAEVIRGHAPVDVPAETPTAALLHDFGKVVLAHHVGPRVLDLMAQGARAENLGLLEAEKRVFGVDHAEIGGLVAGAWRLPRTIIDGIVHHHDTGAHATAGSAAVSLAHAMVPDVLYGVGATDAHGLPIVCAVEDDPLETHLRVLARLGLGAGDYAEVLAVSRRRYCELAARYAVE